MGAMYMECSSKEMSGVHEIFDTAIDIAVRGQDQPDEVVVPGSRNGGSGSGGMVVKKKKRSNCKIL